MKWLTRAKPLGKALHVAATALCLGLLAVGEPECAAVLAKLSGVALP